VVGRAGKVDAVLVVGFVVAAVLVEGVVVDSILVVSMYFTNAAGKIKKKL